MAAINHQAILQTGAIEFLGCRLNILKLIIRAAVSTTQHQMSIRIASGADDRSVSVSIDPKEMMGP